MALLTTLMMFKAGADMFQGMGTMQGAGRQAKIQKEILKKRKKFNLEQIQKSFNLGYNNIMRGYADARQSQIEQAVKGIKDTNIQISASAKNVSLTDSSFRGDIDSVTDFALLENVNNSLQSQENDVNSLLSQNFAQKFATEQQYQDSLRNIDSTAEQQKQVGFSQLLSGSLNLYSGFQQRQFDIQSTRVGTVSKPEILEIKNFGSGFGGGIK